MSSSSLALIDRRTQDTLGLLPATWPQLFKRLKTLTTDNSIGFDNGYQVDMIYLIDDTFE